jgi:hypothetical protein
VVLVVAIQRSMSMHWAYMHRVSFSFADKKYLIDLFQSFICLMGTRDMVTYPWSQEVIFCPLGAVEIQRTEESKSVAGFQLSA